MADVLIARGGTPDFKGWMCDGQWSEYGPAYNAPHIKYTPPYDSHADAAHGQGYLNLHFPLVPNLSNTEGHRWMKNALRGLTKRDDVLYTNWIPTRSYVESFYIEVSVTDPALTGVYVKPVAVRVRPTYPLNPATNTYEYLPIAEFDAEMAAAGITKIPLGKPQDDDKLYGVAVLSRDTAQVPTTFGHNIPKRDATGKPTEGIDDYFGSVLIGLKFIEGDDAQIAEVWKGDFALHLSMKLHTFEGSTQIG